MPALEARGVELAWHESGEGQPVLLIHESAADGGIWAPVQERLAERTRAISYDRRGWGASSAPDDYRRTTVEEQSEDAAALIQSLDAAPAILVGAGVGAVIALDLLLRLDEVVDGVVLIEPPLLQLHPSGTEALSQDRHRLEIAAGAGESPIELFLSGELPALGPGVRRLSDERRSAARERPASVIAELGVATGWRMPLPQLAAADRPAVILTSASTPPMLRDVAAALAGRLAGSSAREVDSGADPPHVGAPDEVAAAVLEVSS